jgi:glycogen debranching enzyme
MNGIMMTPSQALQLVISKDGGVHASTGLMYGNATFGRDSLEVAEDLLETHPELVKSIIKKIAALQGTNLNPLSEEEPGKIHHEYRSSMIDGAPIDGLAKDIFNELSSRWGGTDKHLMYYGTIDATPLFIKVLCSYADIWGIDIFSEKIVNKDGQTVTLWQSLEAAAKWLTRKLSSDPNGLLSFLRTNPRGLENQVWKDSREFYVHDDGSEVNHDQPITSIELQGLAYDALMLSAHYLPDANGYLELADRLSQKAIDLLWMPEKDYFAVGLDKDEEGDSRQIKVVTANPAALMNSGIFDPMPEIERRKYLSAIVRRIFSDDFLTNAGIRSRSLSAGHLREYWDYHGSFVTWPKETFDIASGLRRQGLFDLARQLEYRLINLVQRAQCYPEFVYVDENGRTLVGPERQDENVPGMIMVHSTDEPESVQAWTVSAALATLHRLETGNVASLWHQELEQEILGRIPLTRSLTSHEELFEFFPEHPYRIKASKAELIKKGDTGMLP